jgi:insulysin
LRNFPKQDAWRIVRTRSYEVVEGVNYSPEERVAVAEALTLADIRAFAKTLYEEAYIEALVHGNASLGRAVRFAKQLQTTLGVDAIPKSDTFEQTHLVQQDPEGVWRVAKLEVNNSAFRRDYCFGPSLPQNRAAIQVLDAFINRPFFTELRTNQQLGYVVYGGAGTLSSDPDNGYLFFIIQSSTHTADEVEDRVEAFVSTYPELFEALSQEDFDTFRLAAIEKLKEKAKTIAEKAGEFNAQAFDLDGNFGYEQETIEALESLTKADVAGMLEAAIGNETRRTRTTLGFAREHEAKRGVASSFDDLESWKKTRVFE